MKKKKSRISVNYILIGIIVILLIFLKRMDDRVSELEKREIVVEKIELKKEEKAHKLSPEIPPPTLRGTIGIIIDDFGYRNDEVSDGFLNLDVHLTYAVIPGHEYICHLKILPIRAVKRVSCYPFPWIAKPFKNECRQPLIKFQLPLG